MKNRMKFFTEPSGKFILMIPIDWQYMNIALNYEEKSPFSFQFYEEPVGAFQISCYSKDEKPMNKKAKIQKANSNNLEFVTFRMDDKESDIYLWYANVEDHFFMAKYITDKNNKNIDIELEKVVYSLSSLEFLVGERKIAALEVDRYDKFIASLSATFDMKIKAMESESLIEFLIITANQIDAYLRMSLVLKKQLDEKSNSIDLSLLYQGPGDRIITERMIYKSAFDNGIIDQMTFTKLGQLYNGRNNVVHKYIISDFKTRELYHLAYEYELICETIRSYLKDIEELQIENDIGTYGFGRTDREADENDILRLHSQVNDKHLTEIFFRSIKPNS